MLNWSSDELEDVVGGISWSINSVHVLAVHFCHFCFSLPLFLMVQSCQAECINFVMVWTASVWYILIVFYFSLLFINKIILQAFDAPSLYEKLPLQPGWFYSIWITFTTFSVSKFDKAVVVRQVIWWIYIKSCVTLTWLPILFSFGYRCNLWQCSSPQDSMHDKRPQAYAQVC